MPGGGREAANKGCANNHRDVSIRQVMKTSLDGANTRQAGRQVLPKNTTGKASLSLMNASNNLKSTRAAKKKRNVLEVNVKKSCNDAHSTA